MLPLITATAVHTHTPLLFPSDPRTSDVKKRGNQALPKHFTFFSMLTSSWLAEILHSVHSYLEMQRHWLHFTRLFKTRFCASSHQTNAGERRMYSHTDARYMTHLSLCTPQEEEGTGKALKWTRNSALFSSPPASQLSRHISQFCTWMQRSFVCFVMSVYCNCKPQWDTSVMESVYPIVDILDGGADNILPSGHLRSVITLHLPQPLSFRACRCIKGQGLEKMPDFKITSWLFPFCDSLLTW